jgi:hypothetical protein
MKRRVLIVVGLAVLLVLLGSVSALAWSARRVKGDVAFHSPPEWYVDPPLKLWMHFDVLKVGRKGDRAWGQVSWMIHSETDGWRYFDSRPTCVVFGEHDGKPAAAIVTQITERIGWGWGEPGEYAYFWVRDGGAPASEGDQWGMSYYSFDPFIEFYPEDEPPPCEYFTPDLLIDMEGGDLTVR